MTNYNRLTKLLDTLHQKEQTNAVADYWEREKDRLIQTIQHSAAQGVTAEWLEVIHKLSLGLNKKEKYASIYHLYVVVFKPQSIPTSLEGTDLLLEVKYELAKGLHHNQKYGESSKLFIALKEAGMSPSRLEPWWDQSMERGVKEEEVPVPFWLSFGGEIIGISFIILGIMTKQWMLCFYLYFFLIFGYEVYHYYYKANVLLKDYADMPETKVWKQKLMKYMLLELSIATLFLLSTKSSLNFVCIERG